ncbi:MAG: transposase [Sphaerochaeta sp.]|uniref:IS1634 family transposase n=1 Tax=Sphaerochaeta sp. TaxID=1972642 RepID=UPI003D13FCA9
MYLKALVDIPDVSGKIVSQKKKDSTYIFYEYDRVYDPDRKYNVPKRAVIGKLSPDDERKMYPNGNFLKYFPTAELSHINRDVSRSCCLRIGSWLVIRDIISHYGLSDLVEDAIGRDAWLFLDLAAFSIVSENNEGQYYPDYAYNHPLFTQDMRVYSDSKVSEFLSTMPRRCSVEFLNNWNAKRDHREKIYISYDSTNKDCQAGDIEMLEYGHLKSGKGLPVFNFSVAYDKTNRVPLFYEAYPGSIVDVSLLQYMLEKAKSYGYRRCGFILDRGYFCKSNIQYMDGCGYEFIIMVKGSKRLVSELVMQQKGSFEIDRSCFIRGHRIYGKTVKARLFADDGKDRHFHLFHSTALEHSQRSSLELDLEKMERLLEKYRMRPVILPDAYEQYFELYYNEQDNVLVHWKERADVIQQELSLCGYFAIVTSEKMSAQDAIDLYKSRDSSEKLFRSDKTFLGNRSLRTYSQQSAEAKIFIEFVALIIRNRIYTLLKDEMERMDKRPNYMTIPAALKELDKIEMVRQYDGVYRLDHALTKTQKTILKAFGLDSDSVHALTVTISDTLGGKPAAAVHSGGGKHGKN